MAFSTPKDLSVAVAAISLRIGRHLRETEAEGRANQRDVALAPLHVIRELVEARACRGEHDRVACLRQRHRPCHRSVERSMPLHDSARALQRPLDLRCVAPDEEDGAAVRFHVPFQWRKVLALALPTRNQHDRPRQACERGPRGNDGRGLRVVYIEDAARFHDLLHPVRQALEARQGSQDIARDLRHHRHQRKRRQRVHGIVATDKAQVRRRQQQRAAARQPAGRVGAAGAGRGPRNQPPLAFRRGHAFAEGLHGAARNAHADRPRIIAVQHLHAATGEDARLGGRVVGHAGVAIEMVFGNVENCRGRRFEAFRRLKLEARQLEHEHVGPESARRDGLQHVEHGVADVAGNDRREPGGAAKRAGERRHRRFPIGPCDSQHFLPRRQRTGEQFDVTDEWDAARGRFRDRRLILGDAWTDCDQIGLVEQRRGERAGRERYLGPCSEKTLPERRRGTRVGHADPCACGGEIARHRKSGEPETQHNCVLSLQVHRLAHHRQRSLSEDNPNRTNNIVMIQKRTTTWFSFQPFNS